MKIDDADQNFAPAMSYAHGNCVPFSWLNPGILDLELETNLLRYINQFKRLIVPKNCMVHVGFAPKLLHHS